VRREGKLKKSKFSNHFFYFVFLGAIWMALAVACLKMAKWFLVEGYQSLAGENKDWHESERRQFEALWRKFGPEVWCSQDRGMRLLI
jgi:hypothetical protein